MPVEELAWALKTPDGKIITWTAFVPNEELPWLQYLGTDRMTPDLRLVIERKRAEGYSVVRVRITEIADEILTTIPTRRLR